MRRAKLGRRRFQRSSSDAVLLLLMMMLLLVADDERRDTLVNLVAYTGGELILFNGPATSDEGWRVKDPLPHVGCQGAEPRGVGIVKLAHLRVSCLDTIIGHAWQLGTSRVCVDDNDSAIPRVLVTCSKRYSFECTKNIKRTLCL